MATVTGVTEEFYNVLGRVQDGKLLSGDDLSFLIGEVNADHLTKEQIAVLLTAFVVRSRLKPVVLLIATEHERHAAEFIKQHRHTETSEALSALASEFEQVARAARALAIQECVNAITVRAGDWS